MNCEIDWISTSLLVDNLILIVITKEIQVFVENSTREISMIFYSNVQKIYVFSHKQDITKDQYFYTK